ncbi:hypothetical protein E1B28_011392 [Marasmius oreades]|uniref:GPP34-domain-containing protein n=1 Tax=Marasmius oreades TaxID=181124 RepID=A0A9P7RUL0_9AGAR|nr:uncharacterized protein E1B28_011392 [Marasmius oreades]KAG7089738.1 hypothetical protein E1B28_011392 [Marasmius oreades]
MTSVGLSRRRVANATNDNDLGSDFASSSNHYDEDDARPKPSSGQTTPRTMTGGHGGSAFEGGNRIAFDPRDLEDVGAEEKRVGGKVPRLTIMEEVLLLGIKDKQGYLSFWNDNISYALRGCILVELALRRRIALTKDPNRRRLPPSERILEVLDDRQTGETILDEALRMMKGQQDPVAQGGGGEKLSVNNWIDLLSGETWNVLKIGFQLKQVRERLAKGLVDKGILRTEKRNFLLFDMATHPLADLRAKENIITRVISILTSTTSAVPSSALDKEGTQCRVMRAVCLVCAAYTASVLDNAFGRLGYEEREAAFGRADDILVEFSSWPFGSASGIVDSGPKRKYSNKIATGSSGDGSRESIMGLLTEVKKESVGGEEDLGFELVSGVLEVLSKLDSLI